MGGITPPTIKAKGMMEILVAILQILFKLSATFGLVFMAACTVFVVICVIRGDIKISMVKDETEEADN